MIVAKRGEFLPVRISLVEQRGKCAHKVGDSFIWDSWIRSCPSASGESGAPCGII